MNIGGSSNTTQALLQQSDSGSAASPSISFASDPDTGLFLASSNVLGVSAGGLNRFQVEYDNVSVQNANLVVNTRAFLANGNVALPSLSFANDPTAGMHLHAPNTIGFSTNSVQRLRLLNTSSADMLILGRDQGDLRKHIWFDNGDSLVNRFNYIYARYHDAQTRVQMGFEWNYFARPAEVVNPVSNTTRYTHINILKNVQIGEEIDGPNRVYLMQFTDQGDIRVGNGTVALPSYTFLGDFDTGMYRIDSNQIGFSTAGTNRLSISDGNVTIVPTTASTSSTTGALVCAGGVGVAGNLNVGGSISATNIFQSAVLRLQKGSTTVTLDDGVEYYLQHNDVSVVQNNGFTLSTSGNLIVSPNVAGLYHTYIHCNFGSQDNGDRRLRAIFTGSGLGFEETNKDAGAGGLSENLRLNVPVSYSSPTRTGFVVGLTQNSGSNWTLPDISIILYRIA